MEQRIQTYISDAQHTLSQLDTTKIKELTQELLDCHQREGVIYLFGNGGSGATASHFCGDLLKGVSYGLSKRFKAVCLNDNLPALMAIANDIAYEHIFEEQLKNFLHRNDLVIGISGSGNSKNIIRGIEYAKSKGARTFGLCGYNGGKLKQIADNHVHVNIPDMEISEDMHMLIFHCVKMALMDQLKESYSFK